MTQSDFHPRQIDVGSSISRAIGDARLLGRRKIGVVCSQRCPGDAILQTYDFARFVRGSGLAVVSGFHSPIEKLIDGSDG